MGKMPFFLHVEVATWEIVTWEVALGKRPLGKYLTPFERAVNLLSEVRPTFMKWHVQFKYDTISLQMCIFYLIIMEKLNKFNTFQSLPK